MNHSSDKRPFGALSFGSNRAGRAYQYLLLPRGHGDLLSSGASGGTVPAGYAQVDGIEARAAIAELLRSLTEPWGRAEHSTELHELQRFVGGPRLFRSDTWNTSTGSSWQKAVGDELETHFVLLRKEVEQPAPPVEREPEAEEPPAEAPPVDSTEKTWIEVRVEDEDGNPIRNTRYELKTPDGAMHRGKTDHDGGIYYNNLTSSGSCELTLPGLAKASASA